MRMKYFVLPVGVHNVEAITFYMLKEVLQLDFLVVICTSTSVGNIIFQKLTVLSDHLKCLKALYNRA